MNRYIDEVVVAHKEGDIMGVADDVGIIYANYPYILSVMSQGHDDVEAGLNSSGVVQDDSTPSAGRTETSPAVAALTKPLSEGKGAGKAGVCGCNTDKRHCPRSCHRQKVGVRGCSIDKR